MWIPEACYLIFANHGFLIRTSSHASPFFFVRSGVDQKTLANKDVVTLVVRIFNNFRSAITDIYM